MKFKNKQKVVQTQEVKTPPAKVVTEAQLQDHQKNLQDQLVEAQTKVVMLQGALQMVDLQIKELNPQTVEDSKPKNGVEVNDRNGA